MFEKRFEATSPDVERLFHAISIAVLSTVADDMIV